MFEESKYEEASQRARKFLKDADMTSIDALILISNYFDLILDLFPIEEFDERLGNVLNDEHLFLELKKQMRVPVYMVHFITCDCNLDVHKHEEKKNLVNSSKDE